MGSKNASFILDYSIPLKESGNYVALSKNVKFLRVDSTGEDSAAVVVLLNKKDSRDISYAIRRHEVELDGWQYRDSCVLAYPDKTCILSVQRKTDRDLIIWTFEPEEAKSKERKLLVRSNPRDIEHPLDKVKYLRSFIWMITEDEVIHAHLLELL